MLELNKVHNISCDNLNIFNIDIAQESIDLTVFSPPYDGVRDYDNKPVFDRKYLGKNLFNVTKPGGICCVIINDQTKDFRKSLTTFKWAVEWADLGWNLFETIIYSRNGRPGAWWNQRFRVDHEYILIFFKGDRPKYFNKSSLAIPSKHAGKLFHGTQRSTNGELVKIEKTAVKETKCRGTIWHYNTSNSEGNKLKMNHPATMPDKLAEDLIQCFSKPDDIVFDPFAGSGTTLVMANKLQRKFLGTEISEKYCEIANQRLKYEK